MKIRDSTDLRKHSAESLILQTSYFIFFGMLFIFFSIENIFPNLAAGITLVGNIFSVIIFILHV